MPTNLKRHDELGHVHFLTISCYRRLPLFGADAVRDLVLDCMNRCRDRTGFQWFGYVIMPEHVHWLIYPQHAARRESNHPVATEDSSTVGRQPDRATAQPTINLRDPVLIPISNVLLALKTSIARTVKQCLRTIWRDQRTLGDRRLDEWALARGSAKPIWTTRGIDFNARTYEKLKQKLDYCHKNPVTRGLVDTPDAWRWSSYRFYELNDASALRMDWNGDWPLN